jgi:hypothetical protein
VNIYYDPEKFGLVTIGEIDWSDGCYQFDLTVVWKRESDGRFVYADDSGCSCPAPFESTGIDEVTALRKRGGLKDFKEYCAKRQADSAYGGENREAEVAALLDRMHAAGAR